VTGRGGIQVCSQRRIATWTVGGHCVYFRKRPISGGYVTRSIMASVETRVLSAANLDFWVEVRLFGHHGRWIAVASIAGDLELGWGRSIGAAVTTALSSLGPDAVRDLLRGTPMRPSTVHKTY
jgi:hypothetical protein